MKAGFQNSSSTANFLKPESCSVEGLIVIGISIPYGSLYSQL
jgi:hypothetical protein